MIAQIGEFSFVLAATGLANGAVDGNAYRLAIAVIAVSLLVSPLWMVSVRRFHVVAQNGILDFRAALAEVYSGEIEEFERGRLALGRLLRFVGRQARVLWIVGRRWAARHAPGATPAASTPEPEPTRPAVAAPDSDVETTAADADALPARPKPLDSE
jgi:CPA2 family monovalent cation:H+ antiporter-2